MGQRTTGEPANARYRLEPTPIGIGGYAKVYRATEKSTGRVVALKRAERAIDAAARIAREISAQKQLAHPYVMPILDNDPDMKWYTMPLADGTLLELRDEVDEDELVSILTNAADALEIAHGRGLIHRDISPNNILRITTSSSPRRWVLADWGMVTKPAGASATILTRTGQGVGTDGFSAPELARNPRDATAAADVYSLGRIASWFLKREMPIGNFSQLPDGSAIHWRQFVAECTEVDIAHRVAAMAELRDKLESVLSLLDESYVIQVGRLVSEALNGSEESALAAISLAESHPEDAVVQIDYLCRLPSPVIVDWASRKPERAAGAARNMARHLRTCDWEDRDVEYSEVPLAFVLTVLETLIDRSHLGLAQDVATEYFRADFHWKRPNQRMRTMELLERVKEPADGVFARALGGDDSARAYYRVVDWRGASVVLGTILSEAT